MTCKFVSIHVAFARLSNILLSHLSVLSCERPPADGHPSAASAQPREVVRDLPPRQMAEAAEPDKEALLKQVATLAEEVRPAKAFDMPPAAACCELCAHSCSLTLPVSTCAQLDLEKRRTARLQSELKRLQELNVETVRDASG